MEKTDLNTTPKANKIERIASRFVVILNIIFILHLFNFIYYTKKNKNAI